jgi:hypothetical protein
MSPEYKQGWMSVPSSIRSEIKQELPDDISVQDIFDNGGLITINSGENFSFQSFESVSKKEQKLASKSTNTHLIYPKANTQTHNNIEKSDENIFDEAQQLHGHSSKHRGKYRSLRKGSGLRSFFRDRTWMPRYQRAR